MKTSRKRILVLTVLLSAIIALLGTSSILYANTSLNDLATQNDFHLATSPLVLINVSDTEKDFSSVTGNLFTFTHKVIDPAPSDPPGGPYNSWGVSDSGAVGFFVFSNTATEDKRGKISGSFVINRRWHQTPGEDEIFVSFQATSIYVPKIDDEDEFDLPNYNFRGSFKITGGEGFYEGISGAGTISGTLQDHIYGLGGDDYADRAVEFVMMGKAFAR